MLNENIKRIRKSKGLSQEELAIKLNVVRQTVSKWENGLSVPDSSMLIILANELDTTVSELLGEPVAEPTTDDLKILSEKLEVINLQLAKRSITKVKTIRWILISLCAVIVVIFIALASTNSFYLNWNYNYNDPELAVAGTILHKVLKTIPCRFAYSVANEHVDEKKFHEKVLYRMRHNKYDSLRKSYNKVIKNKVNDVKQGLYQTIYLTLTIMAEDVADAKAHLVLWRVP